ncbi:hypothetical protein [Actinomadura sp. 7K534]|uniref:hypothetical protein n=1 Tax=Actinomadura sp. 7K534 TaxID=2530366 RepID=UPI00104CB18A|nr:hypothetical protein [Actinomadura sp. 7K534]TDB99261.1 hypothetical protein E1266_00255 [Actinomadura sp. 7K534]
MAPNRRIRTRATPAGVAAYDLSLPFEVGAPLEPAALFPAEGEPAGHAAAPDLERAAYTTGGTLVCAGRDGAVAWRGDLGAAPEPYMNGRAACAFSRDGDVVWLYRPDLALRGPGHTDQWLAFDAATGRVLGQADLGSAGHGAHHFVHPDGEHVLLEVGEGQEGSRVYLARLDGTGIEVTEFPWSAALYDLSPDGARMLTVREAPGSLLDELVVRTFPGGREDVVVPAEALGYDEDEHETFFIGWTVGHLDAGTAIVSVHGEHVEPEDTEPEDTEPEEPLDFHRNHLVDVRTGRVLGLMPPAFAEREDVTPLGDGSWLTTGSDGAWYRHTR